MIQTTVKISGMACSMCEAHINDTIRRAFSVEKASSSHKATSPKNFLITKATQLFLRLGGDAFIISNRQTGICKV